MDATEPAAQGWNDRARLDSELALFGHDLADQPPVTMKQMAAIARYDAAHRFQNADRFSCSPVLSTRLPGSTANMRERSECCVRIAIFNRGADKLDQFSDHRIG